MEDSMYNKDNSYIVGRQKKLLVSKSTIQEYPFEWIMRLNSTIGRLYILTHWESVANLENLKNQEIYPHVFGFTCSNDGSANSKL